MFSRKKNLLSPLCGLFLAGTVATSLPVSAENQTETSFPRLFFTNQDIDGIRAKAKESPWLGKVSDRIIARANEQLDTPTAPYSLVGKDNGPGTVGRALQERVGLLAFAGYLTGDARYFQKAKEILLAAIRQAPDPNDKKSWLTHLQVADGAQAFAIGYDWLYPYLSDAERQEVRAQIERFGTWLYTIYPANTGWASPLPSPSSCNHTAVHYGALGLCALVLGDHPEWLAKATERVRAYLKYSMDTTGYVTESHDYMAYGLLGALPFSDALQRSGGPDLIAEQPLFQLENSQILWKVLPGGTHILTLNDSDDDLGAAGMLTYAMFRFHQPVDLWAWLQIEGEPGRKTYGIGQHDMQNGLSAPFILIWGDGKLQPESPADAKLPLSHLFASGHAFLRSSWSDPDAAHVSFTSGFDFHHGHHHQDENAVTFYALREAFLLGPPYECNTTRCHNTMLIGGAQQSIDGRGQMLAFREDPDGVFARGQAASSYNPPAGGKVGNFDRKIYFVPGPSPYLIWRDDASLVDHTPTDFVDLFHTDKTNTIQMVPGGFQITGARTGGKCLVRILNPATGVTIQETDLKDSGFVRFVGIANRSVVYRNHFREATASLHTDDPHFVVLVFPYRQDSEVPKISFSGVGDTYACTLKFSDGRSDTFNLGPDNITLQRSPAD